MSLESEVRDALSGASLDHLPDDTFPRLEVLDRLLRHWSARLDLIGFRTEEERIRRYFAEPLVASSWLPRHGRALDIGSGGGSPGLPFAVASPGLQWKLLEPRRKKRVFLEEAVRELGLGNAAVSGRRFDPETEEHSLAAISTRGVRLTPALERAIVRALAAGGRFLWFSSEARLRGEGTTFADESMFRTEDPLRLLPEGGSFLLVAERLPGECFT